MLKKITFVVVSLLLSNHAFADLGLYCHSKKGDCLERVAASVEKAGCFIEDLACEGRYCAVLTPNCNNANADTVGFTANAAYCYNSQRVRLKDRKVTGTVTLGLIRDYIRHICVTEI